MVLLLIEFLIIVILIMTFSILVIDERRARSRSLHPVKLKGYWRGKERRSVERMDVSLEVKYSINGKSNSGKSVDISTRGLRLLLDEKIETGSPIHLEIRIPGHKRLIRTGGEIVWTAESKKDSTDIGKRFFNTGIKFYKFHNHDDKKLFDFIENISS